MNVNSGASVSVIIPCWRCARTIRRAVASVAAQTVRPGEVIIIDDASGDGTLELVGEIAGEYPPGWVKVIGLRENVGPGPARNAGWDVARGEYIAFLDADDAWHPRKLELQLAWMKAHPNVVLSGHKSVTLGSFDAMPKDDVIIKRARSVNLRDMLISNRFLTRTVMAKRAISWRFEDKSVAEDYLLWLSIVASGAPCYVLDARLAASFRREFDPGGYCGDLAAAQRRVLGALSRLRADGSLSYCSWFLASAWSLLMYTRRRVIRVARRMVDFATSTRWFMPTPM